MKPSQKQLEKAASLGIKITDRMTSEEINALIQRALIGNGGKGRPNTEKRPRGRSPRYAFPE
ncbi:MAG: hypothetical protein V1821_04060 [bacterium]